MQKTLISIALGLFAVTTTRAQAPALSSTRAPVHPAVAAALDDPTIVAIFDAANSWDIETSQVALKKSKNKDVLAFAGMMVKDHTAVRKLGRDLAAKLKVTPTPPGKDFALYVDHEVTYHQAVIDAVTKQLLPATKNAELRDLENKVAPNFVAHLAAGKDVQAKLKK